MSPDPTPKVDLPLELRVHGVGGPQAAKMLGEVDEHEIVTVPAFRPASDCAIPRDTTTRFARRLRDSCWRGNESDTQHQRHDLDAGRTEAYDWGGLTVATSAKALWVLYLPFTLINAAGWAHAPIGRNLRNQNWASVHRALAHVAAVLVTLTYVGWLGYLSLDLVARAWVDHVRGPATTGVTHDFVVYWVPRLAPAVFVVAVVALLLAPTQWTDFEAVHDGTHHPKPKWWRRHTRISADDFFHHERSYARHRLVHVGVGLAATVALLVAYAVSYHKIGLLLLLLAAVQAVIVLLIAIVDGVARRRVRPSELDEGALLLEGDIDDPSARMPLGAAFTSLGTVLAHAAFAGLAMTLSPLLARWPTGASDTTLPVNAELGAGDVFAWGLVLLVVLAAVLLFRSRGQTDNSDAGETTQGPAVRLARRAPQLGTRALLAFSLPVGWYGVVNIRAIANKDGADVWHDINRWYDTYRVEGGIAKQLGALVLVALPPLFFGVLRRPHATGVGRVVGNIWDVLTFWPRRFHPLAVPCSAERSVPELRARIRHVLEHNSLVVVAHSQGSVLSAAAISSLQERERVPGFVTFGSPLGSLYLPTWPAYIPSLLVDTRLCVLEQGGLPWVNFWRVTDPIGAGVPCAENHLLHEPQDQPVDDVEAIADRRPAERPPQWGTVAGHNHYIAAPELQAAINKRRPT